MGARPFHGQEHGPAPFAADTDALQRPQHGQDDRAPDADRRIGRHEGDQEGRDAHKQQRRDQGRLAADPVAVVAEDRRTDRARGKADEIRAERKQLSRQRILIGEVELAKDQTGRRAVEEEVIPLDGGADRRCDDGLAQLCAVLRIR